VVAEERPQGIASSLLEPFRWRMQIAYCQYGVRELQPPRSLLRPGPTGRLGQEYKTRNERVQRRKNSRGRAART
jgi:hypothetical protein